MSFMLNAYSGDTRSPIPVISVHSSGSLVCQPRPINVLTQLAAYMRITL